jgi:hypothetical protein
VQTLSCTGARTVYKELYRTAGRSPYSLIFRILLLNAVVRLLGKNLYQVHIGIGTLQTRIGRLITRYCLYPARYTLFRDQQSYDFARQVLRVPSSKLDVSTDVLFVNPKWRRTWRAKPLPTADKGYKSIIGVNVLHDVPDWIDQQAYIGVLREFIEQQTRAGHGVVMLPFQDDFNPHHDLLFMRDNFGDLADCAILESVPLDLISKLPRATRRVHRDAISFAAAGYRSQHRVCLDIVRHEMHALSGRESVSVRSTARRLDQGGADLAVRTSRGR